MIMNVFWDESEKENKDIKKTDNFYNALIQFDLLMRKHYFDDLDRRERLLRNSEYRKYLDSIINDMKNDTKDMQLEEFDDYITNSIHNMDLCLKKSVSVIEKKVLFLI
jgi:hypothetical protein